MMDKTVLSAAMEAQFQDWLKRNRLSGAIGAGDARYYNQFDNGYDYDFRSAFRAGGTPASNGHWSDIGKKPNHETFSDQSKYANEIGALAGKWNGDNYQANPLSQLLLGARQDPQTNTLLSLLFGNTYNNGE